MPNRPEHSLSHVSSSTRRFTDRASVYARARPGYPDGVYEAIERRVAADGPRRAADMGAGTGIFSAGLLRRGWAVDAVEPNDDMRAVAVAQLGDRDGFRAVPGTAERTGLAPASCSLVVAAQAFHWFEPPACAVEWRRVLRPDGLVALVWNERDLGASGFMKAYEELLRRHGRGYDAVSHRRWDTDVIGGFFGPGGADAQVFASEQRLDLEGLRARLLSASYCPNVGEPAPEHPNPGDSSPSRRP